MKKLTAAWVRKAESDLRSAVRLAGMHPPAHDEVCFHCQQSVEKYLKAMLQELGTPPPRTHELDDLLTLLLPYDPTFGRVRRGLNQLTDYAVDYRYPGEHATGRKAKAAIRKAKEVRQEIRARLGLPPRPLQ